MCICRGVSQAVSDVFTAKTGNGKLYSGMFRAVLGKKRNPTIFWSGAKSRRGAVDMECFICMSWYDE